MIASDVEDLLGIDDVDENLETTLVLVKQLLKRGFLAGAIAIVSHGAAGTLLYCHLAGEQIDRRRDQPPNGGGNFYGFTLSPRAVHSWRRAIYA